MPTVIVDTGPLIVLSDKATDRQRREWLAMVTAEDLSVLVPAAVATEFVRGAPNPTRAQWWLSHLDGTDTSFDDGLKAGLLLRLVGDSGISIVDAHVVQQAIRLRAGILTSDPGDIRRLADAAGVPIPIRELPWPI